MKRGESKKKKGKGAKVERMTKQEKQKGGRGKETGRKGWNKRERRKIRWKERKKEMEGKRKGEVLLGRNLFSYKTL